MYIKAFAECYGVSVRTLRYYLALGLLHPGKTGGALVFDSGCDTAMSTLLRLKGCGLSMEEIRVWLDQEREGACTAQVREERLALLREKRSRAVLREDELRQKLRGVRQGMEQPSSGGARRTSGSALEMLRYVRCPQCGGVLDYENVRIAGGQIIEGQGICQCGCTLPIRDGIFTVEGTTPPFPTIVPLDHHRETYNRMPPEEVTTLQENYNWVLRQLQSMELAGKVIFENAMDVVGFLSTGIGALDPAARYIIADSDIQILQDVKRRIDALGGRPTVLYLVAASLRLPLEERCVDVLIDYYTTEILQRLNIPTLIHGIRPYLRPGASLVGVFTYVKRGQGTLQNNARQYPDSYRGRYRLEVFRADLAQCGVTVLRDTTSHILSDTSALDTYQKGDLLGEYCFWARYSPGGA